MIATVKCIWIFFSCKCEETYILSQFQLSKIYFKMNFAMKILIDIKTPLEILSTFQQAEFSANS